MFAMCQVLLEGHLGVRVVVRSEVRLASWLGAGGICSGDPENVSGKHDLVTDDGTHSSWGSSWGSKH